MSRPLTTTVNTHIDESEQGYTLRPSYLILIGGNDGLPQLNYTTGANFDFQSVTFTSIDANVSRLAWDRTANQNVSIQFSDPDDTIRAYFLNRAATDKISIQIWAGFEDVGGFDGADLYKVFDGFADGQEFRQGLTVVNGIAQDPREFTPRHFVSKDEGFNWITKSGTYVINGQTVNIRPRT